MIHNTKYKRFDEYKSKYERLVQSQQQQHEILVVETFVHYCVTNEIGRGQYHRDKL